MKTKICTKCHKRKKIDKFSKNKTCKDNYSTWCKSCNRKYLQSYYKKHKKEIMQYKKKYRQENKEKIKKQQKKSQKKYYKTHKRKYYKKYFQQYYLVHKEKLLKKIREYHQNHREKLRKYNKKYLQMHRKERNKYIQKYFQNTTNRIVASLRTRVRQSLKRNSKISTTMKLMGCSIQKLRKHLENQFKRGMTWNNYGYYGWHIDHIIPCSKFDLSKPKEQRKCFHYSNLQPLWATENLSKGRK